MTTASTFGELLKHLRLQARLLGTATAIWRNHHAHGIFERELFAEYDLGLPAVHAAMDPVALEQAWTNGQSIARNIEASYGFTGDALPSWYS